MSWFGTGWWHGIICCIDGRIAIFTLNLLSPGRMSSDCWQCRFCSHYWLGFPQLALAIKTILFILIFLTKMARVHLDHRNIAPSLGLLLLLLFPAAAEEDAADNDNSEKDEYTNDEANPPGKLSERLRSPRDDHGADHDPGGLAGVVHHNTKRISLHRCAGERLATVLQPGHVVDRD